LWIIGDTLLKNVYSVFRANPASVGFATLAAGAQSAVTQNGVPTATIGSAGVSVTGSGHNRNAALPSVVPQHVVFFGIIWNEQHLSFTLCEGLTVFSLVDSGWTDIMDAHYQDLL
jgi:hypothetical protein